MAEITVSRPESGASTAIASSAGGVLNLGFDPGAATASRVDNNLVFEVDGGGTVTLTDFFAVGDQTLPTLRLPDGTLVASADFFAGSDLDISTAAGPAAGPAPGSGTNYADDAGSLMGGVDKLGQLGTDYWASTTEPGLEARGPAVVMGAGLDGLLSGGTPVEPTDPTGPVPPPTPNTWTVTEPGAGVYEAWLSNGTAHGPNPSPYAPEGSSTKDSGSFTFTSEMEEATISFAGEVAGIDLLSLAPGESKEYTFSTGIPKGDTLIITYEGNGKYSYEFTLGAAKVHQIEGANVDYLDYTLEINGTWAEGEGDRSFSATTTITVYDDGIMLTDLTSEARAGVQVDVIPFEKEVTFLELREQLGVTGNGTSQHDNAFTMENGVKITAARVTDPNGRTENGPQLVYDDKAKLVLVNPANPDSAELVGLGIQHPDFLAGNANWDNEIGYHHKSNSSDAIIFDLPGTANSMNIDFRAFYIDEGTHQEFLTIWFYLGGQLVSVAELGGTGYYGQGGGMLDNQKYGLDEIGLSGGFDRVVIFPRDNGNPSGDPSDFFIKNVKFEFDTTLLEYSASGSVTAAFIGADGLDAAALAFGYPENLKAALPDGYSIAEPVGSTVIVRDADGALVFQMRFETTEDGVTKWYFDQYQKLPDEFAGNDLLFPIKVVDTDGSEYPLTISAAYLTADGAIHGGALSGTIYGDDEHGNVIYGGGGDNTIYGGGGNNTFAWKEGSFTWEEGAENLAHTDTIMDFKLGEDFLRYGDLFAGMSQENLEGLLDGWLGSGVLSAELHDNILKIQVHDAEHHVRQTVNVHISGDTDGLTEARLLAMMIDH